MPTITRTDGASIRYEIEGTGFPLLLFAPGGVNSETWRWRQRSALNPFELANELMVIGMDQRHAAGSPGPLTAPTWNEYAADQRAVLDEVGVDRALLWGGCIGVAYVLRFIRENRGRVAAAVVQDPVGLVDGFNGRETFWAMFQPTVDLALRDGMGAVVAAAETDPEFIANNAGGPWAARIAGDAEFRRHVEAMDPAEYIELVEAWDEQMWGAEGAFMSVPESFIPSLTTPLLVLPGSDDFHPTQIAHRLCNEAVAARCLSVDCREPEHLADTLAAVRTFLRSYS